MPSSPSKVIFEYDGNSYYFTNVRKLSVEMQAEELMSYRTLDRHFVVGHIITLEAGEFTIVEGGQGRLEDLSTLELLKEVNRRLEVD